MDAFRVTLSRRALPNPLAETNNSLLSYRLRVVCLRISVAWNDRNIPVTQHKTQYTIYLNSRMTEASQAMPNARYVKVMSVALVGLKRKRSEAVD